MNQSSMTRANCGWLVAVLCSLVFFTLPAASHLTYRDKIGDKANAFNLNQVRLTDSRWMDNQDRTVKYLLWIDPDRLLYVFRQTHGIDTKGATPNGGWDAPDFRFRSHVQGHFLTAWAHCYAVLKNEECRTRADYFVEELAKCQANNDAAGFTKGYLSGFPESEIEAVENRTLDNGNVPYYAIHKTMAGLLDVWRYIGSEQARDVLLEISAWVDTRTSKLSYEQMQEMMQTEFGGMNEIMADVYHNTGDEKWLTVAQRFDHAVIFDPLADNRDTLDGLHANTQVPKWIGAIREYKATGDSKYLNVAVNAWDITVHDHSYAIGGNSQAEHFHGPNEIAGYLDHDTAEACNTYNMLKLTRELWTLNPTDALYFDFYERALVNHMIGIQDPASEHGHITYFSSLNPGGIRGVGPALGGGTYSTDSDSFWCCQGTALETNTKLMDSIYFHDDSTLYVNLYAPSELSWTEKNVLVKQSTTIPESDTVTLDVEGSGDFSIMLRIPSWTSGAQVSINDEVLDVPADPSSYATVSRTWSSGDTLKLTLPMSLYTIAANDDSSLAALGFGPTILAGNFGDSELEAVPGLNLASVERIGDTGIEFFGTSDGENITLAPFADAHGFRYNVYWKIAGDL
ncbi:hypothetical protein N3K66_007783 [Trichothecium roseum]|uniref:Uncharacterized protein n=1 Tax=Trichothecium roseum TaxID=47278 RepID=A0ACC0UWM4_9HYPO|nr:hypothetical protein N3K66_007783 [Trichothecium roseum]